MDALYSSHADFGCPENTPWGTATDTNSLIEVIPANIPGEGVLTYNYDAAGEYLPDGYVPPFQNLPEAWITENFNGASKEKDTLLLPYNDNCDAGPNMLSMTDGQRHYDIISSAFLPAPEACNSVRLPEESYQHPSTSFFHPPASEVDSMVVVPSLPPPPPPPEPISYTMLSPDQHSKYSELSANLAYMATLSVPATGLPKEKRPTGIERRKKEKMTTKIKEKHYGRVFELPDASTGALLSTLDWSGIKPTAVGNTFTKDREEDFATLQFPMLTAGATGPKLGKMNRPLPPKHIPPPHSVCREGSSNSGTLSSGKKLGLACLFCRERKIACGRPSGSNQDQTCNQCARRHFKCEYPSESRRGQHKRSKANMAPCKS